MNSKFPSASVVVVLTVPVVFPVGTSLMVHPARPGSVLVWCEPLPLRSLYFVPVTLPHVFTLPSAKSERVDVVSCDARVSARKVEKHGTLAPNTLGSLRSMP